MGGELVLQAEGVGVAGGGGLGFFLVEASDFDVGVFVDEDVYFGVDVEVGDFLFGVVLGDGEPDFE